MTITIRRAYPVIILMYLALTLAGCATTTANLPPEQKAMHTVAELDDERAGRVDDPWQGFNRSMYKFNYNLDKYFLLPIVNSYEFVTPNFAQTGVSNFFNNINEIRVFYNSLFQLKGEKALITFSRFATNSILGLGGFLDVATHFDLKRQNEDFGQTLGYWKVPTGPYLVLPALGPGTARSAGGFVVDSSIHYGIKAAVDIPQYFNPENDGENVLAGVTVMKAIDNRHQQPFRYFDSDYPFEYEMVRFLSRQKREMEVMK